MKLSSKRKSFTILIPAYILLFLAMSCQKDSSIDLTEASEIATEEVSNKPKSYPGVEEELWAYFELFEVAAAAQGLSIDLTAEGITGIIEDLEEDQVAGQCTSYSHAANHVTIDTDFWNRASDNFKEMIIFHELGHCYLDRGHREGQLESGNCISIMRSGIEPCRDAYSNLNKAYYIQELFNPGSVNVN